MAISLRNRIARRTWMGVVVLAVVATAALAPGQASSVPSTTADDDVRAPRAEVSRDVAHDVSAPLRRLANRYDASQQSIPRVIKEGGGPRVASDGFSGDAARQRRAGTPQIAAPTTNFEGISNRDNAAVYGFGVNPPDSDGDVGPNHYVEIVNLLFAVYSKSGAELLGPTPLGALWDGFAVDDCTDPSGDPIVLHDQLADRWILTQFTTRGLDDPTLPFYNCVAISTTSDPTGSYYRYAFSTGFNFPDYPKYGVWTDTYTITTREFGPTVEYGIGVYGLEKSAMLTGAPARVVSFFLDGNDPEILPLVGDGLLPADLDGTTLPEPGAAIPVVGTQDDDYVYGAPSDALNVWDFTVDWAATPVASLELAAQLPVDSFDSNFPCFPTSRDCLPQPGVQDRKKFLDILSYRQRPTWRLAYRNFGGYESMVTNQSVEAAPGLAGVRWYEIRRTDAGYSVFQQGTYAPGDGVHRWMGSIAQDGAGNMALGYSVVNGTNVYPGIRYTGRAAGDTLGLMTLGEGTIINGTGVQRTKNSRWGDYTSMNVDPADDCTFWYVNEYYTRAGQLDARNGWQTRVASIRLPGC